eukprot:scaffold352256_cov49-Attheya_sp.AAC.1
MSSDDESGGDDDDEFGALSEDEDEELLDVEKQSRMIDEEMIVEKREAEEEYKRTIASSTEMFHLPTAEEIEEDENRVVPPSEIRARIDSMLEVLADFQTRREAGRARSEYIDQLNADLAELYGYLPELVEYLMSMFGPSETLEFMDASDKPRPMVIRTNTLKVRRKDLAAALMKRGMTLDPLAPWSKVGLKISASPVPVGATPEYLSGYYMLQSAASMCPVMALAPQVGDKVLDMSAAPGGKTTYLAQLMRNTGIIIANDLKPERQKATVANIQRLGVRNTITRIGDGRKLGPKGRNKYDRVLLDAPCSGLGVISRDPSVKVSRTIPDIKRCGHLQKELLLAAIDSLSHKSKHGGIMVYSTCSVSIAENEEVVNYALAKRDIKLIDTGLDFGKPGFTRYQNKRFHPSLATTRRFYPHVHNMDGFYVAKIQKLSDKMPSDESPEVEGDEKVTADVDEETEKVVSDNSKSKEAKQGKDDNTKPQVVQPRNAKKRKGSSGKKNAPEKKIKKGNKETSVPPTVKNMHPNQKQEKKKSNAKISKPRRKKADDYF